MNGLWAPWRSQYVRSIDVEKEEGCFLCNAWNAKDAKSHLVLARAGNAFLLMNRYPYNAGHLMVASAGHKGDVLEIPAAVMAEIWELTALAKKVLQQEMHPHGFNIGINQGRCAGAGVVDHLHLHIVPRWNGDNNFMPVLGDTRIYSQGLNDLYDQLLPSVRKEGACP
jgi:ATP adenylyltransferase